MNGPTLTVLIPTLGQRERKLEGLLNVLLPQTEVYGGRVRVLALWNNGEYSVPALRQALVDATITDYMCFLDDDDMVPKYYVSEIVRALEYRPDYVGWIVQYRPGNDHARLCYHSLQHGGWFERDGSLYRDLSHINPIRTNIARRVDFRKARRFKAEDRVWVDQVRNLKTVRREVYIDRVMYYYRYSHTESDTWRYPRRIQKSGFKPLNVQHPNFSWYREGAVSERAGLTKSARNRTRTRGTFSSR